MNPAAAIPVHGCLHPKRQAAGYVFTTEGRAEMAGADGHPATLRDQRHQPDRHHRPWLPMPNPDIQLVQKKIVLKGTANPAGSDRQPWR